MLHLIGPATSYSAPITEHDKPKLREILQKLRNKEDVDIRDIQHFSYHQIGKEKDLELKQEYIDLLSSIFLKANDGKKKQDLLNCFIEKNVLVGVKLSNEVFKSLNILIEDRLSGEYAYSVLCKASFNQPLPEDSSRCLVSYLADNKRYSCGIKDVVTGNICQAIDSSTEKLDTETRLKLEAVIQNLGKWNYSDTAGPLNKEEKLARIRIFDLLDRKSEISPEMHYYALKMSEETVEDEEQQQLANKIAGKFKGSDKASGSRDALKMPVEKQPAGKIAKRSQKYQPSRFNNSERLLFEDLISKCEETVKSGEVLSRDNLNHLEKLLLFSDFQERMLPIISKAINEKKVSKINASVVYIFIDNIANEDIDTSLRISLFNSVLASLKSWDDLSQQYHIVEAISSAVASDDKNLSFKGVGVFSSLMLACNIQENLLNKEDLVNKVASKLSGEPSEVNKMIVVGLNYYLEKIESFPDETLTKLLKLATCENTEIGFKLPILKLLSMAAKFQDIPDASLLAPYLKSDDERVVIATARIFKKILEKDPDLAKELESVITTSQLKPQKEGEVEESDILSSLNNIIETSELLNEFKDRIEKNNSFSSDDIQKLEEALKYSIFQEEACNILTQIIVNQKYYDVSANIKNIFIENVHKGNIDNTIKHNILFTLQALIVNGHDLTESSNISEAIETAFDSNNENFVYHGSLVFASLIKRCNIQKNLPNKEELTNKAANKLSGELDKKNQFILTGLNFYLEKIKTLPSEALTKLVEIGTCENTNEVLKKKILDLCDKAAKLQDIPNASLFSENLKSKDTDIVKKSLSILKEIKPQNIELLRELESIITEKGLDDAVVLLTSMVDQGTKISEEIIDKVKGSKSEASINLMIKLMESGAIDVSEELLGDLSETSINASNYQIKKIANKAAYIALKNSDIIIDDKIINNFYQKLDSSDEEMVSGSILAIREYYKKTKKEIPTAVVEKIASLKDSEAINFVAEVFTPDISLDEETSDNLASSLLENQDATSRTKVKEILSQTANLSSQVKSLLKMEESLFQESPLSKIKELAESGVPLTINVKEKIHQELQDDTALEILDTVVGNDQELDPELIDAVALKLQENPDNSKLISIISNVVERGHASPKILTALEKSAASELDEISKEKVKNSLTTLLMSGYSLSQDLLEDATKILEEKYSALVEDFNSLKINKNNPDVASFAEKLPEILKNINTQYNLVKDWDKGKILEWSGSFKSASDKESRIEEMIAVIKKANSLYTGYEIRDVQLISILSLLESKNKGRLLQIATGEGKSTITAAAAVCYCLNGHKVDITTSSPLLAKRDWEDKNEFFSMFGITSGHNIDPNYARGPKQCYSKDIVYGDVGNFQYDILKDEFKGYNTRNSRGFDVILVDEVDSMLVDEGGKIAKLSTPLASMEYLETALIAIWYQLKLLYGDETIKSLNETYKKEVIRSILADYAKSIISQGNVVVPNHLKSFVEQQVGLSGEEGKIPWVDSAIRAAELSEKRNYLIGENSSYEKVIMPVDYANTGIVQQNTSWSNGLQQFLQIKHSLKITPENLSACYISNLRYFSRYGKNIYGMTGTLGSEDSQNLLKKTYDLDFVHIPRFKQKEFEELEGIIALGKDDWLFKISENTITEARKARAVLIIAETIADVEEINRVIAKDSDKIRVYSRSDTADSSIEGSTNSGEIIIATNLAGRGTDIKTTNSVEENGGMHVILTFLPSNLRVEEQAYGRTARGGKKGTGILIINNIHERLKMKSAHESDVSSIDDFKSWRNISEKIRLESIANIKLPKILVEDDLFERFNREIYQTLKSSQNDQYKLAQLEELWGLWLKENSDISDRGILNSKFESFRDMVKDQYCSGNRIMKNPANICLYAMNKFSGGCETAYDESISILESAENSDENYGFAISYNLAYYYLRKNFQRGEHKNDSSLSNGAVGCLYRAKSQIENIVIPQLEASQILLGTAANNTPLSEQLANKISLLRSQLSYINHAIDFIEQHGQGDDLIKIKSYDTFQGITGNNPKLENEILELNRFGLQRLFEVEAKAPPRSFFASIGVAILGVAQFVVGSLVAIGSGGLATSMGVSLMMGGAQDLISAFNSIKDGIPVNFGNYLASKAISYVISFIAMGAEKFKEGIKAIKTKVGDLGAATKNFLTGNSASIAGEAVKGTSFAVVKESLKEGVKQGALKEVVKQVATHAVIEVASNSLTSVAADVLEDNITEVIESAKRKIEERFSEDKRLLKIIATDSFYGNKFYINKFDSAARKILEPKRHKISNIIKQLASAAASGYGGKYKALLKGASIAGGMLHQLKEISDFCDDFCDDLDNEISAIQNSLPNIQKLLKDKLGLRLDYNEIGNLVTCLKKEGVILGDDRVNITKISRGEFEPGIHHLTSSSGASSSAASSGNPALIQKLELREFSDPASLSPSVISNQREIFDSLKRIHKYFDQADYRDTCSKLVKNISSYIKGNMTSMIHGGLIAPVADLVSSAIVNKIANAITAPREIKFNPEAISKDDPLHPQFKELSMDGRSQVYELAQWLYENRDNENLSPELRKNINAAGMGLVIGILEHEKYGKYYQCPDNKKIWYSRFIGNTNDLGHGGDHWKVFEMFTDENNTRWLQRIGVSATSVRKIPIADYTNKELICHEATRL